MVLCNNIKCVVVTGEISQYLDYVPVPYFDPQSCNSTEHYNGQLQVDALCTGTRADKSTCRVSAYRQLGFRNRDVVVWESGWANPPTISSIFTLYFLPATIVNFQPTFLVLNVKCPKCLVFGYF